MGEEILHQLVDPAWPKKIEREGSARAASDLILGVCPGVNSLALRHQCQVVRSPVHATPQSAWHFQAFARHLPPFHRGAALGAAAPLGRLPSSILRPPITPCLGRHPERQVGQFPTYGVWAPLPASRACNRGPPVRRDCGRFRLSVLLEVGRY